jgi:hypothetical protein
LANVALAVESMSCTSTSTNRAGQQWVKPGHDGIGTTARDVTGTT